MNRLLYILTPLLLITFACKKEKATTIKAGEDQGMFVTKHDLLIKASFTDESPQQTIELDLDENGQADIRFISFQDSLVPSFCGLHTEEELEAMEYDGVNYPVSSVSLEILDPNLEIAVHKNSNTIYLIESEVYEEPYHGGGMAIMHEVVSTNLEPTNFTDALNAPYTAKSYGKEEIISQEKTLFFQTNDRILLSYTAYENTLYYKDTLNGLRYGRTYIRTRNHFEVPANELRYLIFRKSDKWGWISIEITEENKISVFESAILN